MLRQAARRCAQARRPSRIGTPTRAGMHSSAGTSRAQIPRRDIFLGTAAAALGFGIWNYVVGPSNVHLDAEPKKTKKNRKREVGSEPPSDNTHTPSVASEASTSASPSTPELIEGKEREAHASSSGTDSPELPPASEGEEESNAGAFNPVTGEINWDCPCLGGMAHGPCGPEFREAFSCFVFSEDEPKGINCVDKFRAMQDCFRAHPDVYGEEIMRDDDEAEEEGMEPSTSENEQKIESTSTATPAPSAS